MIDVAAAYFADQGTRWLWSRDNSLRALIADAGSALVDVCAGLSNFAATLRNKPAILKGLVRRTLFSAAVRLPVVVVAAAAQHHAAAQNHPWLADLLGAVVAAEQVLGIVDITVISIALQRDLRDSVTCRNPESPIDTTLVQQSVTRIVAPVIVGSAAWLTPSCPTLCLALRGCALGCQIHDAAMATRGVTPERRTERWCRDGVVMIAAGVAIDALSQTLPLPVAPQAAQYLAAVACGVVTCQPLGRHRDSAPPNAELRWPLRAPYAATHQLVERLRRMVAAGVFAPNLERRTSLAVTALRLWAAVNRLGWLLPVELARPEMHYLMAELVSSDGLQAALEGVRDLIEAVKDPVTRRATRQAPALSAFVSGLPQAVVKAVSDIADDPVGLDAALSIQEHLARRLSAARSQCRRKPLTFKEWESLGVAPGSVAAWDLDAALSETTWFRVDSAVETLDWVEAGVEAF